MKIGGEFMDFYEWLKINEVDMNVLNTDRSRHVNQRAPWPEKKLNADDLDGIYQKFFIQGNRDEKWVQELIDQIFNSLQPDETMAMIEKIIKKKEPENMSLLDKIKQWYEKRKRNDYLLFLRNRAPDLS